MHVSELPTSERGGQPRYHDGRSACECETCNFVRASNRRGMQGAQDNHIRSLRAHSEIGARFALRTFASWNTDPSRDAAFRAAVAASQTTPALWLWGPPQVGKTHLAAAIANAFLEQAIPTIFTTGVRFLDRVRQSYDRDGALRGEHRDIVEIFARVQVFVLDDLGKERFSEWAAEKLYDLVNRRFETNLPVIVTSNIEPSALAQFWTRRGMDAAMGESIVARLLDMAEGNVVHVG